ncbi:MAG: universal stress protein [Maritimibacter sp.]|nr:universal stress protein [Maritimibacter sp.]
MPTKSILIASDLSARSDRALQRGFLLADQLDARVTVVSIVDDSLPESFAAEHVDKSRDHLEACVNSMAAGVACDIRVETGDPVARLVEIVNAAEFDLAVVGRHRPRGLFDGLRRTTVESVVAQSLTPVLMVCDPVHAGYERILAPVSFSASCRKAVTTALELAPEAAFRLVHLWVAPFQGLTGGQFSDFARTVQRETAEQAATWGKSLPASLPAVDLVHGGIAAGCHTEIQGFTPDLVAVGANTRTLSFTGLGSFTAELVRDPPTDLLIARGGEV